MGGLENAYLQRLGDMFVDGLPCLFFFQQNFSAQKIIGWNITQHDIGIGKGWFISAFIVAGRAGLASGAFRAHPNLAAVVYTGGPEVFKAGAREIGIRMFEAYILPFEAVSILLLSAIVGVLILSQRTATINKEAEPR